MTTRRSRDLDAPSAKGSRSRERGRRPKPLPHRIEVGPLAVYEMMLRQGLVVGPEEWMRRLPKGMPAKPPRQDA